ncbi:MAG: hypothetical protein Q8L28_00660, partial [bacterium]|nr:hypothetical protein [bacterium]
MLKSKNKINKKHRKYVNMLGIRILSTTTFSLLASVEENISDNIKFSITTPNPELVLASTKDPNLKQALNASAYSVPDGIGLAQAVKFLSMRSFRTPILKEVVYFIQGLIVGAATLINPKWLTKNFKIIKGRVLFNGLIKLANEKKWKVFFLGGENDEAELAARKLILRYK